MNDFNQFKDKVKGLVKAWKEVIKPGIEESRQYGETNTRKYLIDLILEALNWVDDGSKKIVDNEFAVKHKTGTGSADYALKVNDVPKILLEAKDVAKVKDLENGYDTIHGIKRTYPRQLSNYCHDLNHIGFDIKFAILTNGKEWVVYNMQYADISSEREVVFRLDIEELDKPDNLQKLWALEYKDFSDGYHRLREIIQQLHDYRLDIDKKAVQQLLECKDLLSSSIINDYEKNKRGIKTQINNILKDKEKDNGMPAFQEIPEEERLNFFIKEASSSIINKILFIRILEDKNFLTPKLTKRSIEKWKDFWGHKDYREIMNLFREACRVTENTYNGGLFRLNPYDKVDYDPIVIKKIIDILGDINFRDIDSDIIGRIYEIYLGQILKVEAEIKGKKRTKYKADNKERKKLGQYYTPKFVVDFIVKNTLGKLIEGKKPEEVSKIKILDPACGSGSFLINAYDSLVEYYENYNKEILRKIEEDNKKKGAKLTRYQNNSFVSDYKNIILKENLHGVDLNDLSVQIAEINLWLRALERDKKLIKLNKNILHGNSLVTGVESNEELDLYKKELEEIKQRTNQIKDYYEKDELNTDEKKRLEALELRLKVLKEKINVKLNENLKGYFGENFKKVNAFNWEVEFPQVMQEGGFDVVIGNPPYKIVFDDEEKKYLEEYYPTFLRNNDLYVAFIQKSIRLLKDGGFFSFIVPNTYLAGPYFNKLRDYILKECKIVKILDFGINQVFEEANVFSSVIIFQKDLSIAKQNNQIELIKVKEIAKLEDSNFIKQVIKQKELPLGYWGVVDKIIQKLRSNKLCVGDIAYVKDVGLNYWTIGRGKKRGGSIASRILYKGEKQNDKDIPFLKGGNIERYYYEFGQNWLKYNYKRYLDEKVDIFRFSPKFLTKDKKIIYRQTASRVIATLDKQKFFLDKTAHLIVLRDKYIDDFLLEYLLAILNSKLMLHFYRDIVKEKGRVFAQVKTFNIKQIPIIKIKKQNQEEFKKNVDKIINLKYIIYRNQKLFFNSLSNQSISDPKFCKFIHYFDNYELYDIQRETSGRINEIKAKILSLNVKEEEDKLVIYMTNYNEEQKQLWKNIKAVTLTIKDEDVRKFLFFSIKKYINEKRGRGFGKGNLLELIKKIEIPVYVANVKMNIDKIKKVMKEFNHNTKDLWWKDENKKKKFSSFNELEDEIQKIDREIDEMVYDLYGINEKEKKIIEESLR